MSKLVVGQFGGPTPVINATLAGIIEAAQQQSEITAVYGLHHGFEGALKGEVVDLSRMDGPTRYRLSQTPAAALGGSRYRLLEADYAHILKFFQAHDVHYFAGIGGNGTMYVCQQLAQTAVAHNYPLNVIGVPKTIDNDILGIDHCPGYGSAARFLALATRDTGRDLEAMATFDDVTILEVMGRNTGWLAAATILAKNHPDEAPHLIYVPEHAFNEDQFLADVQTIHRRLGYVFVVVSEGIKDEQGVFVGAAHLGQHQDHLGRIVHSRSHGVASYLSDQVANNLDLQSRFLRPGLIGRAMSSCVSTTDWQEAMALGWAAVAYLIAGQTGQMVTLIREGNTPYRCQTGLVPLTQVAGQERPLPAHYIHPAGNMITDDFYAYASPLLGQPFPVYIHLTPHTLTPDNPTLILSEVR